MTESEKVIRYLEQFARKNYFPDNLMAAIADYTQSAADVSMTQLEETPASESDGQ